MKNIYMCCKDKSLVPSKVVNTWKKLNPDYDVHLYDDKECYDFINTQFGLNYAEFFKDIPSGPIKADFWRLCVLFINGGVYADIDLEPLVPLSEIIAEDACFCTVLNFQVIHIFQAFIFSTKHNAILKLCIDFMYSLKNKTFDYWQFSGTFHMFYVLKLLLTSHTGIKLLAGTYSSSLFNGSIQLLQEYAGSNYEWKDFKVMRENKHIFNSRYKDYDPDNHCFIINS